MSVKPFISDKPIDLVSRAYFEQLTQDAHEAWLSTFTMIRHRCEQCHRTHPDEKSAIICTHDNLEDKTMAQANSKKSKATPKNAKLRPMAKKKARRKTKKA